MISINDLIVARTKEEIETLILDVAESLTLPARQWDAFGVARTIIALVAVMFATLFSPFIALVARSGFLDYATKGWLTLLAWNVYGVERFEATYAPVYLTITNTSGSTLNETVLSVRALNSASGKTFVNQVAVLLLNGASADFLFHAEEAGSASNSAPGEISELETTILGVAITNALAAFGSDEETDPSVRVRCRAQLAAISPGGLDGAYLTAASRSATSVPITRAKTVKDDTTGILRVYLATAAGGVTGPDITIADAYIQKHAAPDGTTAIVATATEQSLEVSYDVWVRADIGLSEAQVKAKISEAITAFIQEMPIGGVVIPPAEGRVYRDAIVGVIYGALLSESFPRPVIEINLGDPNPDASVDPISVVTLFPITEATVTFVAQ